MKIKNQAMLITYSDSLGKNLKDLKKYLGPIKGCCGRYPYSAVFPIIR